jgi:predicted DNA-binding transcriptional regulator YafY
MRADRLLSIMLLLQVHKRITARELARRLEVSERTIHRDMEALGAAGIPVYAERGNRGGWVLPETYQTNLTGLNDAEVQALFVTNSPHLLADLGLHKASEAALIKLLAALPAMSRRDAEFARQRIHIDGAGWQRARETVPFLPTVQEAIWQDRKLYLIYQRGDDTIVERLVDPLGLVAKGSVWYLVAAIDGDIRTYRIARLQAANITEQPCQRPRDFDLAVHWERSSADFRANLPRYPVTLRAQQAILPALYSAAVGKWARIECIEPPDPDGWAAVAMLFEEAHNACEYVLSFGPQIEVLEPAALRDLVIEAAQGIVALYARHP